MILSIILTNWFVYSPFPGGHVRLSLRCPHALHSYLQILGPRSHWYAIAHVVSYKLLPRVTVESRLMSFSVTHLVSLLNLLCFCIRCSLAWYDLLDGVPAD